MRNWLILLALLTGPIRPAGADIEFGVTESAVQKLFQSALPTSANPALRDSVIPNLHFVREERRFVLTNLREGEAGYPSIPKVYRPGSDPDLHVRIKGDRVAVSLAPTEVRVRSEVPLEFKIPGPTKVTIPYGEGGEGIDIDLEKVTVRLKRLDFHSTAGALEFGTNLKLSPQQNGSLVIEQESTAMRLDPNGYRLEFGDFDLDLQIPGFKKPKDEDKDSPAYRNYQTVVSALTSLARRYIEDNKAKFTARFSDALRSLIEKQLQEALTQKINPALQEVDQVNVLKEVKDSLSFVPASPSNSKLFGILQGKHCPKISPERRLQMGDNDVVVGIDQDGLNRILASPETKLDEVILEPRTGAKIVNKERPRVKIEKGRVFVTLFGEYQPGRIEHPKSGEKNQDIEQLNAATQALGVDRIEGKVIVEVKPTIENGKLQLLMQDVQSIDVRAYDAAKGRPALHSLDNYSYTNAPTGVRTRFEKLSKDEVQVVVEQRSFDEVLKGLTSAKGALSTDERFRMLGTPKVKLEKGELTADFTAALKTDTIPALKKKVDERLMGADGKPLKEIDATVGAKLRPEVVQDPRTGKRYLQLDLVEITHLSSTLTKTDPKNVRTFWYEKPLLPVVGLFTLRWPSTVIADKVKGYEKNMKTMAIEQIQEKVSKAAEERGTNLVSGLEFTVPKAARGKPTPETILRMRIDVQDPNFEKYFSVPFKQLGNQYELDRIAIDGTDARLIWKVKKLKEGRAPLLSTQAKDVANNVADPVYMEVFRQIVGDGAHEWTAFNPFGEAPSDPPRLDPQTVEVVGDQIQLGVKLRD